MEATLLAVGDGMSGAVKYADIAVQLTVRFEDDGKNSLTDQALEAADDLLGLSVTMGEEFVGMEVVGEVRDTELPAQKPSGQGGASC